uniref:Ig-like domain-containing protein n=1 Tax=Paramormyrops kingsleyae TaxID=1676925 RepID=A0A3B3QK76_9TELE
MVVHLDLSKLSKKQDLRALYKAAKSNFQQKEGVGRLTSQGGESSVGMRGVPAGTATHPAGLIPNSCRCCLRCSNTQEIYGRGGEGLRCRRLGHGGHQREEPEAMCVCRASGSACGSGGCSHPNLCELRKAATIVHFTACTPFSPTHLPLRDLKNYTGNDIIFSCKVSAFPLPHLSWRKKGIILLSWPDSPFRAPRHVGDHRGTQCPHGSRSRVSCTSRNELGETSASASMVMRSFHQQPPG